MHRTIDSIIAGQEVYFISERDSVLDAARYMSERNIGAVSVIDDKKLIGVVSERDLMKKVVAEGRDPATTLVGEVMSRRLAHGALGDTFQSCIEKMQEFKCRHLPILGDGNVVIGMVSIRDLYRQDADEKKEELADLAAYMYSVPPSVAKGSV